MGGYTVASSPEAFEDKSDGFDSADDAKVDDDGLLSDDDDMSTWYTYPFVTHDKKGD